MVSLFNKREINKRIVVSPLSGWARQTKGGIFQVKHDIPGEQITCTVPTLEIGGCIVQALRERMYLKLAQQKLSEHMQKKAVQFDRKGKFKRGETPLPPPRR